MARGSAGGAAGPGAAAAGLKSPPVPPTAEPLMARQPSDRETERPATRRPHTPVELPETEEYRPPQAGGAAPETSPTPPPQKAATLESFRLLRKLGSGSMGTVYHARRVRDGRDVALKLIDRERARDAAFLERFYREARLLARLNHLHIVRCYGAGTARGWHALAMEYAGGGSLQAWLDRLGRFPVGDAVHVALACARALEHAHDLNLVHRDVKPENVLLTEEGLVKMADLGLAKALDDGVSVTQTGTAMGTPLYMAPEQATNAKHVDGRSDIYALGCMVYHLLAGRPPFAVEGLVNLLLAKEKGKYPPLRSLAPEAPAELEDILAKMLARRPEDRYQSCGELIADLEWLGLANPALSFLAAGSGR
jgi:serine/threonine-protein kinase